MWQGKIDRGEVHQSQMEEMHGNFRNVVTEFKIPLAVVKSKESAKKHTYEHKLHHSGGSVPNKTEPPSNIVRS